jgi:hypothetical protein
MKGLSLTVDCAGSQVRKSQTDDEFCSDMNALGLIIASVGIRRVVRDAGIFVIPTNRSNRIMDRAVSIVDIVRRVGKCSTGHDKKQVVDGPHLQM